jgi:hypothetical protein
MRTRMYWYVLDAKGLCVCIGSHAKCLSYYNKHFRGAQRNYSLMGVYEQKDRPPLGTREEDLP